VPVEAPAPEEALPSRLPSALAWIRERLRPRASYWLTRFFLLRLLGFVYFFAFLSLAQQVLPLVGKNGLLPASALLEAVRERAGSTWDAFFQLPSLFWVDASDATLQTLAWVGTGLSLLLCLGAGNAILLAVLWALYQSFVQVGQLFYGYGWEIELLEAGFLAIFLCPLLDPRPFPRRPPPAAVIWLYRWLAFRIMLGAGLIKLRGDPCWRDLTCLYYHYETQPIPNPLSPLLHEMPHWFHNLGVLYNHLCEIILPFFVFGPRLARHIAGVLLVLFQVILIASGNLSFLNWLTIVPMLACFDDSLLSRLLPRFVRARVERAREAARPSLAQKVVVVLLCLLVAFLSYWPIANLFSSRQQMNASFDPFSLVNTYGAFGSVGRTRREIVLEGTSDEPGPQARWREYEFKCKPGDPLRRPCWVGPYHYRLDWQIWFAAMSRPKNEPWLIHFIWKLLHGDAGALSLLEGNPFPEGPPRYIRGQLYRYELAPLGETGWWKRTFLRSWLRPISVHDERLRQYLIGFGWIDDSGTATSDSSGGD
jgi:hypothetical protein